MEISSCAKDHTSNPDRSALFALYHATDGPNWIANDNRLTGGPLAEWRGVTVNANGRVSELDLVTTIRMSDNRLTSNTPPALVDRIAR